MDFSLAPWHSQAIGPQIHRNGTLSFGTSGDHCRIQNFSAADSYSPSAPIPAAWEEQQVISWRFSNERHPFSKVVGCAVLDVSSLVVQLSFLAVAHAESSEAQRWSKPFAVFMASAQPVVTRGGKRVGNAMPITCNFPRVGF